MSAWEKRPVEWLLANRQGAVDLIADIDAELTRRGLRPIQNVIGRPRDMAVAVYKFLADHPAGASVAAIAQGTGQTRHAAAQFCSKMSLSGELQRVDRGIYAVRPVTP